jgi:hypothetical protein
MKKLKIVLGIYGVVVTSALLWTGFRNTHVPSSYYVIPLLFVILINYPLSLLGWKRLKKYKVVLFITGFLSSAVILIAEAIAVRTLKDFLFTLMFFPVFLNFLSIFIHNTYKLVKKNYLKNQNVAIPTLITVKEEVIEDESRRRFLKILAGAGIGAILLYVADPKKAGAAFFGSIPGPGTIAIKDSSGAKIDPAIKSPTDSFGITNTSDSGDYPHYYGFEHYNGTEWYIIKENPGGTFTYASKLNNTGVDYSTAWSSKGASLTFGSYSAAF